MFDESEQQRLIESLNQFYKDAYDEQVQDSKKKFRHNGVVVPALKTLDYNAYGICPTCWVYVSTQDSVHKNHS